MDTSRTPSPAAIPPPPALPTPARRLRTWPAALALYFLAPGAGEVISGSTPPLAFVQPFGFIFIPLLYGSSAILIHEVVVRRHLGWGNVLLLGAAFGAFQEALVVQTWFTYLVPGSASHDVGSYGALGGINWPWALNLSIYHGVISIATPLALAGLLFPRRAGMLWLGRKGAMAFVAWLLVPCAALALQVATHMFAKQGYAGPPPGAYLAALGITLALVALGAFVRFSSPPADLAHHAPRLWTVRLSSFALVVAFFAQSILLPKTGVPAPVALVASAGMFAFGVWRVRTWSARPGWDARHRLALVSGVVAYFAFVWAPLVEFVAHSPTRAGLTLFDLLVMVALALLARQLGRHAAALAAA